MIEVRKTRAYDGWIASVRDVSALARINARIRRLSRGNPGDVRPVGADVGEPRVDDGPGYRVYFMQRGQMIVVLICGGDKRTQDAEIFRGKDLAKEWIDDA